MPIKKASYSGWEYEAFSFLIERQNGGLEISLEVLTRQAATERLSNLSKDLKHGILHFETELLSSEGVRLNIADGVIAVNSF